LNDGDKQPAKTKRKNEIVKIGAGICASINIPEKFVILVKAQ
jgi:hypothetical protein